jgi:hypothetical protein
VTTYGSYSAFRILHSAFDVGRKAGLEPAPHPWKGHALPVTLLPHIYLELAAGLEPATYRPDSPNVLPYLSCGGLMSLVRLGPGASAKSSGRSALRDTCMPPRRGILPLNVSGTLFLLSYASVIMTDREQYGRARALDRGRAWAHARPLAHVSFLWRIFGC